MKQAELNDTNAELNDTDIDWIYFGKHFAYLEVPVFVLLILNVALFMYRNSMMTCKINIFEIMKIQSKDIRKEGLVFIALILMVLVVIITYNVEVMVIMASNVLIVITRLVLPGFKAVYIGIQSVMIVFLFIYLIKSRPKIQKQPSDTNIHYQQEETQLLFPNYNSNGDDEELEEDCLV